MTTKLSLNPDRLFPIEASTRSIAKQLYSEIKDLPIVSPHGHTDPKWFAENHHFKDPTELLIKPDHYIFRMLYSQGIDLDTLGITTADGQTTETDSRKIWSIFARHYFLFRGTPSRLWFDYVFQHVFSMELVLCEETADDYYDKISEKLASDAFKPRVLFDAFNIDVLVTTESPLDTLEYHIKIKNDTWSGRVLTAFRPDPVVDPEFENFSENVKQLGEITGEDVEKFEGYLAALRQRREYFKSHGATSTDHGHPSALTCDLDQQQKQHLLNQALSGEISPENAELFRGQMLTEMAGMSIDDGLVMQIHPGSHRNHNTFIFNKFGRDKGADMPTSTEYVQNLSALLNKFGNDKRLNIILFTLDETTYSRELAPLAGHYPCLKLGPAWWFHDSPEGMLRFRQQTTETAGFYNTVGFNDDTRAFLSIPARHDVARRMDCYYLSTLVAEGRLDQNDACELAIDLSYNLAKQAYKL